MKTIPPPCPEPEVGPKYWRSLDQLAETPEFRQWMEREFPSGASEFSDPVSRRNFVKIMSASFLLAGFGLTGCRRPEHQILPFSKMPENYTYGMPKFYATAMPVRGSAIPLVAKSNEGRPTKLEGNALHPDSNGATDPFAQASLLSLYDPDRALRFTRNGETIGAAAALDELARLGQQSASTGGKGLAFLLEESGSPSRIRLQKALAGIFPQARWYIYEPVDFYQQQSIPSELSGKDIRPFYKLDQAKVIFSLDCDFIGAEENSFRHIRDFAKGRKIYEPGGELNRLYVVEALMTQTGANADHRLAVSAGAVSAVAAALAAAILPDDTGVQALAKQLPLPAGVDRAWIKESAADLLSRRGASVVMAGHRQPPVVHALAHLINAALGNIGKTIFFQEATPSYGGSIEQLAKSLEAGEVDTLLILGGNPVYNAPADLNWAQAQKKAKTVVRLGYYEDETAALSTWHFPMAHYLESWGDARAADGSAGFHPAAHRAAFRWPDRTRGAGALRRSGSGHAA